MSLRRYRPVALVLVVLHLSACTSWQPISLQTGPVPEKVRVTTETDRFVLTDTRLVGDTAIAGRLNVGPYGPLPPTVMVVDGLHIVRLTDASLLERATFSPLRTIGLVAGLGFAALFAAMRIACAGDDNFC